MKLIRYGKTSRSVSAVSQFQPTVQRTNSDQFIVTGRADISGDESLERGTEVRVQLTESELRQWLSAIDRKRAKDIEERELAGARAIHALELIHSLLLELSYESTLASGSLTTDDRRIIKLVKRLAGGPDNRSIRQAERRIALK